MKRAIIVPPMPSPEALAELKQWLALSGPREDAVLERLLGSAIELCESFTGQLPLNATCEEILTPRGEWQTLATRPVQAVIAVESLGGASNGRSALAAGSYAVELDPDGCARLRVSSPAGASRIAVRFVAGIAATWSELPESLRHGIVRLAAHQHRARESAAADPVPPAAVTALWRPWRRLRLA